MVRLGVALLTVLSILFPSSSVAAEERPILAVFDIEDTRPAKVRLSDRERADLTSLLVASLTEGGVFRVVPSAQIRAILQNKKNESFMECFDESCQVEIGRELAAQKTLSTRIIQMGKRCAVIGTLYDLRQAASERATVQKGPCSREELLLSVERMAKGLQAVATRTGPVYPPPVEKLPLGPVTSKKRPSDPAAAQRLYQQGIKAFDAKKTDQALAHFADAEKAGFDDWRKANDLYHHWGETYRTLQQDLPQATKVLRRCVDVSEDKTEWPAPWCMYLLGSIAYGRGDIDRAIGLFLESIASMGEERWLNSNDVYHMLGEAYRVHKKDPIRAAEYHQKAIDVSKDKKDWPAFWSAYVLGLMANEAGDGRRAIEKCQLALALHPDMHWTLKNDIYHVLGEVYRNHLKDLAKATAYHQRSIDVSEDKRDWPAFWSAYVLGLMANAQGEGTRALERCQQALAMHPDMDWKLKNDIYHVIGEIYRNHLNDQAKAAAFHQRAMDISKDKKDWPAFWSAYVLGLMAQADGDAKLAVQNCEQALAMHPDMDWKLKNDIYHVLGEIYRNLVKDRGKAADYHQRSVDVSEGRSDWPVFWSIYLLGYMAFEDGDTDRAIEKCELALATKPDMDWIFQNDIYHVLGEIYRNQKKDLAMASQYHLKAWDVSEDKTDWPAAWSMYIAGYIANGQGDGKRAVACFEKTEPFLSKLSWIHQNDVYYAWAESYRLHLRKPEQALAYYGKCSNVSSDLSDWPAYWCLMRQAEILETQGRAAQAAEMFKRAKAAGQRDAGFLAELVKAQQKS